MSIRRVRRARTRGHERVLLYVGEIKQDAVLEAADNSDPAHKQAYGCEANFYSGEYALIGGNRDEAVKLFQAAVKESGLKPDRQRILDRVNEIAAGYPNADEVRRNYLQNTDAMRSVESAILEDQALDWVLERATITDKVQSFSELTGFSAKPSE